MNPVKHKPSILLIHHSAFISGAEISFELLAKSLRTAGYAVFAALPGNAAMHARLLSYGITVTKLPHLHFKRSINPFVLLKYAAQISYCSSRLLRLVLGNNISLVHANTTAAQLCAALPAFLTRRPLVWHVRDNAPLPLVGPVLVRCSSKIICLSQSTASLKLFKNSRKVAVVNNGLDAAEWQPMHSRLLSKEHAVPSGCIVVTQLGQLVPWKNHKHFILVAEKLVKLRKNFRFLIAGSDLSGDNKAYLDEMYSLVQARELTNFFIFKSFSGNVKEILSETHILFHPAASEPFGRVIIEAMALKKPVVAVDSCGPSEIVVNNQTGFLLPPGDIDGMAQKVLELADDSGLRERMGNAARARVEERYTIEAATNAVELLYKQLLPDEYPG